MNPTQILYTVQKDRNLQKRVFLDVTLVNKSKLNDNDIAAPFSITDLISLFNEY